MLASGRVLDMNARVPKSGWRARCAATDELLLAADAGVLGANLYLRRTADFVERRTVLEGARWVDRPHNEGDARHWRNGRTKTAVPSELVAATDTRDLLDAHLVRRLDAAFNLRLTVQNLLRADTRRFASAWNGADAWRLDSVETGQRTWFLALEGKW